MKSEILVIGSSNADLIVNTDIFPSPGETILGNSFVVSQGGKGANQAVAAARAGAHVTFIGGFGKDEFARKAIDVLNANAIDTSCCIHFDAIPSGVAIVMVNSHSGENMIVVSPGANMMLKPQYLKDINFGKYKAVICQLESPVDTVAYALRKAKSARVTTILNPAPAQKLDAEIFRDVDILTPNEHEMRVIAQCDAKTSLEDAAKALLRIGVERIIVTRGSKGATLFSQNGSKDFSTKKVTPVDTVGAGDCFNGCLATALAEDIPIEDAIRFALHGATLSTLSKGAQTGMPYRQAIDDFVSS